METTRMSSKGQVIIPKEIRDAKGWREGAELIVENRPDGVLLKRRKPFKPSTLEEIAAAVDYKGPSITVEEMNQAIEAEWRKRAEKKSK